MSTPVGLGWWVAFERSIDDGPKAADLARAIDVCRRTGASWIAVRGGAGGGNDADLNAESIAAYKAAGLGVYVWIFDYPGTTASELAGFKKFLAAGADGAIFNAEFEYLPASDAQATALVRSVRDLGYDFVAHAPPDYAGAAGQGPLDALDATCDAIMPQCYAFEHDDKGHVFHINRVMDRYAARGYGQEKVWPILCSYRPKYRGYDSNKKPIPLVSLPNEAAVVATDVVAGLDACVRRRVLAPSIYTIDATHFVDPVVGKAVIAAVEGWARRPMTTMPSPPLDPGLQLSDGSPPQDPYRVDRLESSIAEDEEESKS